MSNNKTTRVASKRLNLHIKGPMWARLKAYVKEKAQDSDATYAGEIHRALDKHLPQKRT